MRVEALSPIKTASLEWTSPNGQSFATIVAKLTFDIHPTQIAPAAEQEEIVASDKYHDEDPGRSLFAPSDLVPYKARADVVVVGHAYAPNREPVRVVRVRLAIRECDKALEVFGDRAWGMDGEIREGPRFVKMPLRWERAAGGPYTPNPIGIRSDVQDSLGRILVPNLVVAGKHLERRGEAIETAGLGPVSPSWPLRRPLGDMAGGKIGHAEPAFYNCAPADQQLTDLPEDELLILENLHPSATTVSARLPGIRPRAFLERSEVGAEIPLRCDTLWIDTDRALLTLTWRGRIAYEKQAQDVLWVVTEHRGSQVSWATVVAARAAAASLGDLDPSSVTHVPTTKEPPLKAPEHLPFAGQPKADGEAHKTFHSAPPAWVGQSPLAQLGAMTAQSSSYPAPPAPVAPSVAPPAPVASVAPPAPSVAPPPAPLVPQSTVSMQAVDALPPPAAPVPPAAPIPAPPAPVPAPPAPMPAPPAPMPARPAPIAAAPTALQTDALHVIWFERSAEEGPAPDRASVSRALLGGKRAPADQLLVALREAVDESGELVLPNVVVAGDLALRLDPVARLKATLAVAKPQAATNKQLAELCREGMLVAASELPAAPGIAEAITARIREVAPDRRALDEAVERMALVGRAYERYEVLGGTRICATMSMPSGAVTVYIPAAAAAELPLLARFPAVLLGSLRPPQDPLDASPVTLLVSAIGRLVPIG